MKDTFDHKLEIGGCLHKAYWHPEPLELTLVGNEVQVIRKNARKWDIVEASLQVQHVDPLSPPKLYPVLLYIIELVLVLGHPFIDQDYTLANPVRLPGLNTQYKQQWCNTT